MRAAFLAGSAMCGLYGIIVSNLIPMPWGWPLAWACGYAAGTAGSQLIDLLRTMRREPRC